MSGTDTEVVIDGRRRATDGRGVTVRPGRER
jgi:hypothetical protein